MVQLLAKTVLAELAVRRGDQDAGDRVADLAEHADRAAEPQRIMPAIELMAERALTEGEPMPVDWFERLADHLAASGGLGGRYRIRLAGWAAVAGLDLDVDGRLTGPTPRCTGATGWRRRTSSGSSDGRTTGR